MIPDEFADPAQALELGSARRYQSRILGRLCLVTAAGFLSGVLILAGLSVLRQHPLLAVGAGLLLLGALCCLLTYRLVGAGRYRLGVWVFETAILGGIATVYWLFGTDLPLAMTFVVPIIIATVLMRPAEALAVATGSVLVAVGLYVAQDVAHWMEPAVALNPLLATVVYLAIVLIILPVSTALLLIPATSLARLIQAQNRRLQGDNAALQQAQAELRRSLGHQQVLYEEAQQAIRVREEFLGIASHELKTPLTGLRLLVQVLARQAQSGTLANMPPDRLSAQLARAERQTHRLNQLIDRLLDITQIAAGRMDLVLEDVDLSAVVQGVADQLADELAGAGCPLTLDLAAPVVGRWDRARLEQVVANLLGNAVKYGRGRPIAVAVTRQGAVVSLLVADQGIGIAPEDVARIFQRFERAVATDHYGGFGLGLYIVQQIVTALGGTVQVTSAPGAGATFRVKLPLAGPP